MPPAVRRLASTVVATLGALALAAPALAENAGLTPVEPMSPNADAINDTYYLLVAVGGFVFLAVHVALAAFLLRYRRGRRAATAEGPQIHGNTRLEVLWTIVPLALVTLIVGFVFYKLPAISEITGEAQAAPDDPTVEVEVLGRQYFWEFRYPNGRVTYDTLVVPARRTVELAVTAPDHDVIHSWWIPALGGKIDAIPGQRNHTWFRAREEGEYEGSCTEFCGVQHGAMTMTVRATGDDWEREVERLAGDGEAQFEAACAKCHNVEGPQLIGPTLQGNPTLADFEQLAGLLRNGRNKMPAVGRGWSDAQIRTLLEYTQRIAEAGSVG